MKKRKLTAEQMHNLVIAQIRTAMVDQSLAVRRLTELTKERPIFVQEVRDIDHTYTVIYFFIGLIVGIELTMLIL